jgi:thioredoxin reductase
VGVITDKGKVLVNDFYQTNIPGVYAIGDIAMAAYETYKSNEKLKEL